MSPFSNPFTLALALALHLISGPPPLPAPLLLSFLPDIAQNCTELHRGRRKETI